MTFGQLLLTTLVLPLVGLCWPAVVVTVNDVFRESRDKEPWKHGHASFLRRRMTSE
jgi:hypothetical protein